MCPATKTSPEDRVLGAYYTTREILRHVVFADDDLKQQLLNIATLIFCQNVFSMSEAERAALVFSWEDLPFRVAQVPPASLFMPCEKPEDSSRIADDPIAGVFPYLQSYFENFCLYRPMSLQGPFQTHRLRLGPLRERFSFDQIKQFIFNLWQHGWFYLPEYAAMRLHDLYRDKLLEVDTNAEIGGVSGKILSRDEFDERRKHSTHTITLLEPMFEALGKANAAAERDTSPLRELAIGDLQDCESNLSRFRREERGISNWAQFIHVLYVPYTLSMFLLKEVYYSVDDPGLKSDVERAMCVADERRTDISDYLKNPHLKTQAVLSDIARAMRERGPRARERAVKYHFEGRVFLPLSYAEQFAHAGDGNSDECKTTLSYQGLSAGHVISLEESRKYTESLTRSEVRRSSGSSGNVGGPQDSAEKGRCPTTGCS